MRYGRLIGSFAFLSLLVAAPATAASVTLAWDSNTDGVTAGYYVYYGTTSRLYSARVDAGSATQFTVTGLLENTKYFLAVRAYDRSGYLSDYSLEISGLTTNVPVPPPPTLQPGRILASLRADRYIDLAWSGEAASFRVEVGTLPGFTAFSAVTTQKTISFDMADLIVPAYFIRVRPIAGGTLGPASNEVAVTPTLIQVPNDEPPPSECAGPPGTPRRFMATALGAAVSLTWQRGVGDAPSGYWLEVGSSPGQRNLMTVPLGATPSLNATAASGVYALRLLATNACGTSAWGAEAMLTVNGGPSQQPPGVPQTLTGRVTGSTVTLSWGAPLTGGTVNHYVLEATVGSITYTLNTGSALTTATFTNVPPGQYVVRVRAVYSAGTGPLSSSATINVF